MHAGKESSESSVELPDGLLRISEPLFAALAARLGSILIFRAKHSHICKPVLSLQSPVFYRVTRSLHQNRYQKHIPAGIDAGADEIPQQHRRQNRLSGEVLEEALRIDEPGDCVVAHQLPYQLHVLEHGVDRQTKTVREAEKSLPACKWSNRLKCNEMKFQPHRVVKATPQKTEQKA